MPIKFKGDMSKVVAKNKGDMTKTTLRKRVASIITQLVTSGGGVVADYYTKLLLHFNDNDRAADVTISSVNKAYAAIFSPDKSKIYIGSYNGTGITVLDAATYTKIKSISTPSSWSIMNMVINPAGTKLYASGRSMTSASVGQIIIVDLTNDSVITRDCYNPPMGIDITPNGKFVFFGTAGNNSSYSRGLWMLNTTTNVVSFVDSTGSSRYGVAVSPDGTKLITSYGGSYPYYTLNQETGAVSLIQNISIGAGGSGSNGHVAKTNDGVWFSDDGATISKFNWNTQSVSYFSTAINSAVLNLPLSVTPDGKVLYVSNGMNNTCYSIDAIGFKLNGSIAGNAHGGVLAVTNDKILMLNHGTSVAVLKDLSPFSDTALAPLTQFRTTSVITTSTAQSKFGGKSLALNGTNTHKLQFGNPKAKAIDFGTSNWTIEGWFYFNQKNVGYQPMVHFSNFNANYPGPDLYIETNNCLVFGWRADSETGTRSTIASSFNPDANRWYHIAAVRNGSTVTLYVDGTSIGTQSVTSNVYSPDYIGLGVFPHAQNLTHFNGYMDGIRIQVGEAVYTGNFTAPTSAPVANSYTKLLMNFDSVIKDESTSPAGAYAVGSTAVISTMQSKFGGTSLKMSGGTTDYVKIYNNTQPIALLDRPFTIEGWYYLPTASLSGTQSLITFGSNPPNFQGPAIMLSGGTFYAFMSTNGTAWTNNLSTPSSVTANTWHHFALVREAKAGSIKLYHDGTLVGTAAISSPIITGEDVVIGHWTGSTLNGYVDEVRVLLDTCAYYSDFIPPTKAFELGKKVGLPETVYEIDFRTVGNYTGNDNAVILTDSQGRQASWKLASGASISSQGATGSVLMELQKSFGLNPFGRTKKWRMWVHYSSLQSNTWVGPTSSCGNGNPPAEYGTGNTGGSSGTTFPVFIRDPGGQVWGPSYDGKRGSFGAPWANTTNVVHVIEMENDICTIWSASAAEMPSTLAGMSLYTREEAKSWQKSWNYGTNWSMNVYPGNGRVTKVRLEVIE